MVLKAAPNRQNLPPFLKDHYARAIGRLGDLAGLSFGWPRVALASLRHNAQGNTVTKLQRPSQISRCHQGLKWALRSRGASCGVCSPRDLHTSGPQGPGRHSAPAARAPYPKPVGQHLYIMVPTEALPPSREDSCSECQGGPPGLPRGRVRSVPVEFFQHCGVGVFKQPLLGG